MSATDWLITARIVSLIVVFALMIFGLALEPMVPYGDIVEKTGYVVDVDYSAGGYMMPCKTYVQWGDGTVIALYGDGHQLRSRTNATLVWQERQNYDHFLSFTVLP